MKGTVDIVLVILCVASVYQSIANGANALEIVGYVTVALLSASLILILHLKPTEMAEPIPPLSENLRSRSGSRPALSKK